MGRKEASADIPRTRLIPYGDFPVGVWELAKWDFPVDPSYAAHYARNFETRLARPERPISLP